jgi:hypothetical protein
MSTHRSAIVIELADSAERVALAAKALADGRSVALLEGTLILRPAPGELRCEVVDPAPSARRCVNEYEVLVENAQRALEVSTLAPLLPNLRRTWLVVGETASGATELWYAP